MTKREISSTLKNLKFMQRAAQREEMMVKKEEVKPEAQITSHSTVTRKCLVIMEGDPFPGAVRGRISFQSFNPSIDKLNEEASKPHQPAAAATENGGESLRGNGTSTDKGESSNPSESKRGSNGEHKRKQSPVESESPYPNKSPKSEPGNQQSSSSKRKGGFKKPNSDKLGWNLLRRSKS